MSNSGLPLFYDESREKLKKYLTPRYRELDALEAYVEGRQYVGRPHWFTDTVPMLDRAPHVIEPIVESTIESYQDLLLGEGRFPSITSKCAEEDKAFDDRFGLSDTETLEMDALIRAICHQVDLQKVAKEGLAHGMGRRTALLLCGVRDGELYVEALPAKAATATRDPRRPKVLTHIDIKYPYIETRWNGTMKKWEDHCLLFRRVIDTVEDTTFFPVEARSDGEWPTSWTPNPDLTVRHGLGFCPAVWFANNSSASGRHDHDGVAIHERLLDEIDALNRCLSQRNRASVYAGDPQLVGIGVAEEEAVAPGGSASSGPSMLVDAQGRVIDSAAGAVGGYSVPINDQTGGGKTKRRGVSTFWSITSPQAKVEYLTIPSESLKPLDDDIVALRSLIDGATGYVRPLEADAGSKLNISRLSSKTLGLLFSRQTSCCDTMRPDVWRNLIHPLVGMLLRICFVHSEASAERGGLYLGGMKNAKKLLGRYNVPLTDGSVRWFNPPLMPIWGEYFRADETDELTESTTIGQDLDKGIITLKTAIERRSKFYHITNVDEYLKEAEADKAKRADEDSARVVDEATAIHEATKPPPKPAASGGRG